MACLSWLDFSETDRQRALDVIDAFREQGTVDELGIGTIRDAIADLLFPGTSTIMTRARYYLFVPWIYLRHEKKKTPSNEIAQAARKDEIALIEALAAAGETRGVIGIEARAGLKRLPSTVYWQALGVLGIRRFQKSIEHYHRALDSFYRRGDDTLRGDDKHVVAGGNLRRWDPSLPSAPDGFPKGATPLALSDVEATYLKERVMHAAPHSLFAWLVDHRYENSEFTFPWEHPQQDRFTDRNRMELSHARNFAEVIHGAALLYNLMLAQKNDDAERIEDYEGRFGAWADTMTARARELNAWVRDDFWKLVLSIGARIPVPTQVFVKHWLDWAIGRHPAGLAASRPVRAFITAREKALKGALTRLDSTRSLSWGGASSSNRLDYRWNRPVRTLVADIRAPLD